MKKFVCVVCGYIHEGETAPEVCPVCKVGADKFEEMKGELKWADEHRIGAAQGVDEEILEGLRANFVGECTEVGMYLAMSRQADREGYPEVAEAYKRIAFEEAEHAARFAELLGEVVVADTQANLKARVEAEYGATEGKLKIAKKAKELGLRPGVGLAAPQIGINKKMFTILANDLEGKSWLLAVVNPKIIKKSKELIYLPGGEGCLSVDRETCGITPRHERITVEADLLNVKTGKMEHKKFELTDYIAIVFQHEYDHLFGTLYIDTIMDEAKAKESGLMPLWEIEEEQK